MMVQLERTTLVGNTGTAANHRYPDMADAQGVHVALMVALIPTASAPPDDDLLLFNQLVDQWHSNTRGLSSTNKIIYDDAYQEIMGFGKQALPWIFNRLERENDHWYWALACITHQWPVPEDEEGNMSAMRKRWLDWGRSKGYVA